MEWPGGLVDATYTKHDSPRGALFSSAFKRIHWGKHVWWIVQWPYPLTHQWSTLLSHSTQPQLITVRILEPRHSCPTWDSSISALTWELPISLAKTFPEFCRCLVLFLPSPSLLLSFPRCWMYTAAKLSLLPPAASLSYTGVSTNTSLAHWILSWHLLPGGPELACHMITFSTASNLGVLVLPLTYAGSDSRVAYLSSLCLISKSGYVLYLLCRVIVRINENQWFG